MKKIQSFIILYIIFAALTASAYIVPESPGTYTWKRYAQTIPARDSESISTYLYVPDAAGQYPFMVFRHGFTRSKASLTEYGEHFASRGFIVVLNDSRSRSSYYTEQDSSDMIDCANWIVLQNADTGSFLYNKVDIKKAIIAGFSAGGYAAEIATYKNMVNGDGNFICGAMMLFDPAPDDADYAASIATQITCPSVVINTRGCSMKIVQEVIFPNLASERFGLYVKGADHCDAEGHYSRLCSNVCTISQDGGWDEEHNKIFRRYGTAFLESYIKCVPDAYTYVNGLFAQTDTNIRIYSKTNVVMPPATCSLY